MLFVIVEDMPEFAGGQDSMYNFIYTNLKFPTPDCIEGRCIVSFIVEKDGSLSNIKVVRGLGVAAYDEEAMRVIKLMPQWKAGKQRGKEVRVQYNLPIHFKVDGYKQGERRKNE